MGIFKRTLLILSSVIVLGTIVLTTAVNWYSLKGFEHSLSRSSGLDANIRSARLGILSGVRFNGISLATPDPDSAEMWRADWIQLNTSPENLSHRSVFAESMQIQGLSLLLQRRDNQQSSYQSVLDAIATSLKSQVQPETADTKGDAATAARQRRFQVDEIQISGISVRGTDEFAATGPSDVSIKIENITLLKVGGKQNGLTLDELSATVLFGILHHVAHRERTLPSAITRELRLQLGRLTQPDAELASRSRTLGETAGDQGQAFFDKAIEAIDKFMETDPNQISTPEETAR